MIDNDYLFERNDLYKNVVDFLVEETSTSESEVQNVLSYEDILFGCVAFKVTIPQLLNLFGRGRKYEREFLTKSHIDGVVCDCILNRNDP